MKAFRMVFVDEGSRESTRVGKDEKLEIGDGSYL